MILNLKELINKYQLKITGVIHVGAHHGQETKEYIDNNIEHMLYFEPVKKNFQILQDAIIHPNIKLVNAALGSENKKIYMNIESINDGMSSSILTPKYHLSMYPHITFTDKEEVNMMTLDTYMEMDNFVLYNFLNIDVQGYELEVLNGAISMLDNIDYIMTEINIDEMYENCVLINELDLFLNRFNFHRVEIWHNGSWGDAFYIKSAQ